MKSDRRRRVGRSWAPGTFRVRTVILGAVMALLMPAAVLAAYPPGPFPGPAPVGAFPIVVVSQTVCGAGQISAEYNGSTVTVDVPADAFSDCTQVTVYGMSGDSLALLLPDNESLTAAFAVGWDGDAAGAPLTLTVDDPAIAQGSSAYRTSGSGLTVDPTAVVAGGRASTSFSEPVGFVVAAVVGEGVKGETSPPAPQTSSAPDAPAEPGSPAVLFIAMILAAIALLVLFAVRRHRTQRDALR